jgi:hypothetical protein
MVVHVCLSSDGPEVSVLTNYPSTGERGRVHAAATPRLSHTLAIRRYDLSPDAATSGLM